MVLVCVFVDGLVVLVVCVGVVVYGVDGDGVVVVVGVLGFEVGCEIEGVVFGEREFVEVVYEGLCWCVYCFVGVVVEGDVGDFGEWVVVFEGGY